MVALFVLQGRLARSPHVFIRASRFFSLAEQGGTKGEEPRPARGRGAQDEALDFAEHRVESPRHASRALIREEARRTKNDAGKEAEAEKTWR